MCHVSSNQLDKANQSKGRQDKSCMNCPDRNNNVDLLPYKDTNCQGLITLGNMVIYVFN